MKNDSRSQYTLAMIRKSFLSLLKQKPIEKIKVKEICDLANINRATFYRYYNNQYELLSSIEEELLADFADSAKEKKYDIDGLTLLMFQKLYDNKDEWLILMNNNIDTRLMPKVFAQFNKNLRRDPTNEDKTVLFNFLLYGYTGLFEYWVKTNFKTPPETMAKYASIFRHKLID